VAPSTQLAGTTTDESEEFHGFRMNEAVTAVRRPRQAWQKRQKAAAVRRGEGAVSRLCNRLKKVFAAMRGTA
jgi:hypothetical protein